MNSTLLRALIACVLVGLLFAWAIATYRRASSISSVLLVLGSGCLGLVVVVHVFEAEHILSFMGWGSPHSVGHYIDFACAVLGLLAIAAGLGLRAVRAQSGGAG